MALATPSTPARSVDGDDGFRENDGILVPKAGTVAHQAEEYDPRGFEVLLAASFLMRSGRSSF